MHQSTCRAATLDDIPAILEITNHEILNSTVLYEYEPRTIEQQTDWFNEKTENNWPILVAELNGKVVGFGTYGPFRARAAYRHSIEHSVYVQKDFRGKTVGHQLMVELIRLARIGGYHTMIAGIDSSNKGSVEFHRKFGFETVGTFREVGFKFNRWLDVVFMQLML
ncbi:MAG: N-acetyltransferase [Flavobacteriales bacterium]|nr:N-acetyltransferase [Flavobacteriales bacterium]MCB9190353.1 N-acetyltransferase [Flavobacteriales bacterium]MCB9204593.1 N-acetyltransferase [Flavobacteriales bacterium]